MRCIKRNIGHLCHDEPREPESASKKAKHAAASASATAAEEDGSPSDQLQGSTDTGLNTSSFDPAQDQQQQHQQQQQDTDLALGSGPTLSQGGPLQIAQPAPVSGSQANALNSGSNQCGEMKPPVPPLCTHELLTIRLQSSDTQTTGLVPTTSFKTCTTITPRTCSMPRKSRTSITS